MPGLGYQGAAAAAVDLSSYKTPAQINTSGVFASRPAAATAGAGVRYLATDTGIEYLSDGSAWMVVVPNEETLFGAHSLTSGEAAIPRIMAVTSNGLTITAGTLRLTYFTARKTESITQIATRTGGTAAGATPTLVKMGIYSVAGNGDLTLITNCASDTSLFATTQTTYTRNLLATFSKVRGTRYALGVLIVTAATAPTIGGFAASATEVAAAPKGGASLASQTDLPATITDASLASSSSLPQILLIP